MQYAILAAVLAAAAIAYSDPAAGGLIACLFVSWWAYDWVAACRRQAPARWNATRALYFAAGCEDPGPWVEPIPLTLANEGGDS